MKVQTPCKNVINLADALKDDWFIGVVLHLGNNLVEQATKFIALLIHY